MTLFFRENRPLFIAAFVSVVFIPFIWQYAMLSEIPKLEKSRSEIVAAATEYAQRIAFPVAEYNLSILSNQVKTSSIVAHLHEKYPHLDIRRILRDSEREIAIWSVSWNQDVPLQTSQTSLEIELNSYGEVKGFSLQFPDSLVREALPLDSAKMIAIAFLKSFHAIDVTDSMKYPFVDSKIDERKSYKSQTFNWHDQTYSDSLGVRSISVAVVGRVVKSFNREVIVSESVKKYALDNATALFGSRGLLTGVLVFLTLVYLAVIFLKKYHEGEVGVRSGTVFFIFVFALGMIQLINTLDALAPFVNFGLARSLNKALLLVFGTLFGQLLLAGIVFFAWTIGESDARYSNREFRIIGLDSLLQRQLFSKPVGKEIFSGMLFGIVLSFLALVVVSLSHFLFNTHIGYVSHSLSESFLPMSSFTELSTIVTMNILIRLFLFERFFKKFKRVWVSVLVSGVVWAIYYHYFPTVYPFGYSLIGSMIVGIAISYFSFHRGVLAAVSSEFIYYSFFFLAPLLLAPNIEYWGSAAIDVSIIVILFGLSAYALVNGSNFSFKGSILPTHVQRISQRARMEEELKIARETQLRLLPQSDPKVLGLDVSGICLPALEVGGDYYDYMPLGNGKFAVAIGDVSGKGVPAAMYMTMVKGLIQFASGVIPDPKQVLCETNRLVYQSFKRGTFVSMIYAVIDVEQKTLRYSRAGHNPLLLLNRESTVVSAPMPKGMALGLSESEFFSKMLEETMVTLQTGDTLVFYTDGFSEAKNDNGEEFGEQRLMEALHKHAQKMTAREIVQAISKEVQRFSGFAPQHDDMTMVILKVN